MTNGMNPKPGYKFINPDRQDEGQVLESVMFGTEFKGAHDAVIGEECTFGNYVNLNYGHICIGDHVVVGSSVRLEAKEVGNRVTIGDMCIIGDGCEIEDDAAIGNHVTLHQGVKVKQGVVIPDHWEIPYHCIVNPGPNGTPVVIPPYPQFHCNVTTNPRW